MNYFFAYSGTPRSIGDIIETTVKELNGTQQNVTSWKSLAIVGSFIRDKIKEQIDTCDCLIADITVLNLNVTFEIGYAIGIGKPVMVVKNQSIKNDKITIREVGIFDTIGYKEYQNSVELTQIIQKQNPSALSIHNDEPNYRSPVFLLETKIKSDYSDRITSRIKKAKLMYRSFDPNETPRLSAYDAIKEVSQSFGVVVSFLNTEFEDSDIHNIRAAFIAGLATGMGREYSFLQYKANDVPIDFRDFVSPYNNVHDINTIIEEFAEKVVEALQKVNNIKVTKGESLLQKLDIGASAAENEMKKLSNYYLKTDAYLKSLSGENQLVVGRKGAGKTAIFLQIRDKERSPIKNIVLDLKPEGYKLIKFKDTIINFLEEGTFEHTIAAFWEYVLLLELCHKIVENHTRRPVYDSELYEPYDKLRIAYEMEGSDSEGDFSERLSFLIERFTNRFKSKYGTRENIRLNRSELTDLLYKNDIFEIRKALIGYLKFKDRIWLLFDNIDKGWASNGLSHGDLVIIRTLIDACRKIQRFFFGSNINVYPVIFLRNDVYEHLVKETSDRQKESKVILDWVDIDLLRELIRLRIESSLNISSDSFEEIWRTICTSHYAGEESFQFLVDRCLMRPRFLINLINHCKSYAVNLNHKKIEKEDIKKGLSAYSVDVLTDISYELRDISDNTDNILYNFISCNSELTNDQLKILISETVTEEKHLEEVKELLLWYGFLGIKINETENKYIYNFNYNMLLMKGFINKLSFQSKFVINPAFWSALEIKS